MATQKATLEFVKEWQAAETMQEGTKAARAAAQEFDGLYADSAKNLLGRSPELLLLLTAYLAGKEDGMKEGLKVNRPGQATLEEA